MNQVKYRDASSPVEERVADLLERMTTEEKLAQMTGIWALSILEDFLFSASAAKRLLGHGIGQISRLAGGSNLAPADVAELSNSIQSFLVHETRLGIPAIIHEECCSGFMTNGATLFPQALGMAATWRPDLVERMAGVIRCQMRAVGTHQGLAPVLDVTRDPRWGRIEETFGEDPLLAAAMGCAYIRGLQGEDLQTGVAATGKHFVGYGNSEGGLNWAPCHIPPRELREVFLLPFQAAVQDSGLASIMNSYSEIDGIPCAASKLLFRDILRKEWGFSGVVVSDYEAVAKLTDYHHCALDRVQAAVQALKAGIDVELPAGDCYGGPLRTALEQGLLAMEEVDEAVRHVLLLKFRLGLFEKPLVETGHTAAVFDTPAQRKLAGDAAAASVVLLQNDGILPLSPDLRSIAVIGPNADDWRNMMGDYAYPCHLEALLAFKDQATAGVPIPATLTTLENPHNVITVLRALRDILPPSCAIHHTAGCRVNDKDRQGFTAAAAAARRAEVAIVVAGDRAGLTLEATSGESRDRTTLGLPGVQEELVHAIAATGVPVVLVLIHGRPFTLSRLPSQVRAILTAWLPGEEGGRAVADALLGRFNPGGRLPVSFPRQAGQVPVFYSHRPSGQRSHWHGDYLDCPTSPLFPFGHGLSYTSFHYEELSIDRQVLEPGAAAGIRCTILNSGPRTGDEVVQLYIRHHPAGTVLTRPVMELKGFARITLPPGERKVVQFQLSANQLAFVDEDLRWALYPGEVEVMLGASSADIRLRTRFRLETKPGTPVSRPALTPAAGVECQASRNLEEPYV